MPRHDEVYFRDILGAIEKIESYTTGVDFDTFLKESMIHDAVVRNLEIIGEAAKKLSDVAKSDCPDVEWRKMAGLRDILIHEYFGVNLEILWDVVKNKLPALKEKIQGIS